MRRWGPAVLAGAAAAALLVPLLHPAALPWSLPLVFLVVPLVDFAATPVWRRLGVYRYHSPVLFTVRRGERTLELHGGTLYDYLPHVRGAGAARALRRGYLAGLLAVIDEVEAGRIAADVRITGTSYFFGDRTLARLGFRSEPAGLLDRTHLLLNAVGLTAMYSLARGRPALPPLHRARRAAVSAAELARRRPEVERILDRLNARRPPPGGRGPEYDVGGAEPPV